MPISPPSLDTDCFSPLIMVSVCAEMLASWQGVGVGVCVCVCVCGVRARARAAFVRVASTCSRWHRSHAGGAHLLRKRTAQARALRPRRGLCQRGNDRLLSRCAWCCSCTGCRRRGRGRRPALGGRRVRTLRRWCSAVHAESPTD